MSEEPYDPLTSTIDPAPIDHLAAAPEPVLYLREFISAIKRRPEIQGAFARFCKYKGIRRATKAEFDRLFREFSTRQV